MLFAGAEHAGEHLEGVAPAVVPGRVGVGAGVKQRARDLHRVGLVARQSGIGQAEQRRPAQRAAREGCGGRVDGEAAFDLGEVAGRDRGVEVVGGDLGQSRQHPGRCALIAAPGDAAQHAVDPLGVRLARLREVVQGLLERAPAGLPVLAGEGELHIAQARLGRCRGRCDEQPRAGAGARPRAATSASAWLLFGGIR
ncbi:MAG: hypothetical protein ABI781_02645, partial [Burkholderiales bacterium]